jgi:hypothetical protein
VQDRPRAAVVRQAEALDHGVLFGQKRRELLVRGTVGANPTGRWVEQQSGHALRRRAQKGSPITRRVNAAVQALVANGPAVCRVERSGGIPVGLPATRNLGDKIVPAEVRWLEAELVVAADELVLDLRFEAEESLAFEVRVKRGLKGLAASSISR